MEQRKNGFVVSAVLYPLLVLFLAIIMGLLSMSDTRKRILDKMKLEISDSIFDEATCSCDTILNKLNYLIKNGTGGGGGGSLSYNALSLNVLKYETPSQMPSIRNNIGNIAVITDSTILEDYNYYVANRPPNTPKNGDVWIVQDVESSYYVASDYSRIGINYAMEYVNGTWHLRRTYVYTDQGWTLLYYVPVKNGTVDLSGTDIHGQIENKYSYTGKYQKFHAYFSGYYKIELWGAQGGTRTYAGGLGSYTSGEVYLNAGDNLYVYVGGTTTTITGGWNGGGDGYNNSYGRGGGGATDVRLVPTTGETLWNEFDSLKSRIMVAAGGGGSDYNDDGTYGGAGGGLFGNYNTSRGSYFRVANQTMTGTANNNGGAGAFGKGGNYATTHAQGGTGGGGGYYGGGGGYADNSGSQGGTSYISGHAGCNSLTSNSTAGAILHTGSSYHYSGYFFINTTMVDGAGYQWTSYKESQTNMPNTDGVGTKTGNSGNGYAKITLTKIQVKSDEEQANYRSSNDQHHYSYAGSYQIFEAPKAGKYKVELWGGQGGTRTYAGGKGAYTSGEITLTKGQKFYIYVGAKPYGTTGAWNGGGTGYSGMGSGGGGATDIRSVGTASLSSWNETNSLRSRIMVAGAGGGSDYNDDGQYGGAGGGLTSSYDDRRGGSALSLASQIAGGQGRQSAASLGGFGYGGSYGATHSQGNAGGGSGWFGGGGGAADTSAATGGTSYISGHAGCIGINASGTSLATSYSTLADSYSYTGFKFTNTNMIDGNGYQWTTKKLTQTNMPAILTNGSMTGNTGDGYARITFLG